MTDFSNLSVTSTRTIPWELKTKTLVEKIHKKINYLEKQKRSLEKDKMEETETYYLCLKNLQACKDTLKINIEDEDDYEFVNWLYNNAHFRTETELKMKIEEVKQKEARKIRDSEEYNKNFHPFRTYIKWFFLLPLIGNILVNILFYHDFFGSIQDFIGIFAGGTPVWMIGAAIITYVYIKRHDQKFQVPTDPALVGAIAAATTAGIVTYKVGTRKKQESSVPKEI
jgi:hypothetical protein